ncbi:MAG: hypothetical protein V1772_11325 [Chloroflexota bacterium]
MPAKNFQDGLNALRRDNRSSAAQVASHALDLLIDTLGDSMAGSAGGYRQWLVQISRQLMAAQPAMAMLFRLVNDMLWACHAATTGPQMRQQALGFLQGYRAQSAVTFEALAAHAAEALEPYRVIMTYSNSSSVARTLIALKGRRRPPRGICSEARPILEGQALASELAWAGLHVTVGIDMALFGWLPEAEVLVLGADSLMATGVVNKLGTAPLVRAAAALELPRIVVCTTDKFLPNDYAAAHMLRLGAPEEIMPVSNDNIVVQNSYFDITPLDLFTQVITERGPLVGGALTDALARIRTYPGLRGR